MPRTILLAAAFCAAASAAQAATFDLRYTFANSQVLTAIIEGTLQADGDTIIVSAVTSASVAGEVFAPLPFIAAFTNGSTGTGAPPVLTLSGSGLDFLACDTALCGEGFGAAPAGAVAPGVPEAFGYDSPLAGTQEAYAPARYSLTATAAIPLPAGALLLLTGLGTLAIARKGRPTRPA